MRLDYWDTLPNNPANQLDHNDLVEAEDEADCMTPSEYQDFIINNLKEKQNGTKNS